jgi:micrococcal nuclease
MLQTPVYKLTNPDYVYDGVVADWVDGDTVKVDIYIHLDFGFKIREMKNIKECLRLNGINTPERGQAGYHEATDFCEEKAPVGTEVIVKTYKMPTSYSSSEKYGRYLADIYVRDLNLNEALVASGLAVTYDGKKK